ncbi:hypothetical protein SERLADRAFT_443945 [Serpula lacrymans var. lacrymans S7.9]|uniref:Nucleolus and neural progenitor protein-like N-terminal domain-containing protein n=1 Tax=Serpula lacrymans var. lacrymans (strain S7.9) TaxID=578457 RepID=F8PE13_SERL9|nr:uncharacterized protein SERLADRAFT_443945 [Serpula lacrymans var. lacrymans S7.9]EGO18610.1 hypothetical protein SERLADRAFT_443945 [Serpula lacrymans var. lacrymans S7.9]
MDGERYCKPPPLVCSPRNSIDPISYPLVDASLKDLKTCSRRLQTVSAIVGDELKILERLYYKGKNQHRSALFWKRVVEIRRYGRRLSEASLWETLELFRCSFFEIYEGVMEPLPKFTICAFRAREDEMNERLMEAYRHFKLAMQTGAFIQLILLLAAITSRLLALTSELEEILQLAAMVCTRIMQVSDPARAPQHPLGSTQNVKATEVSVVDSALDDVKITKRSLNETEPELLLEDTGDAVARPILRPGSRGIPIAHPETPSATNMEYRSSLTNNGVPMDVSEALPSIVLKHAITAKPTSTVNKPKRKNKDQVLSADTEKLRKAKKKKKDEIDDIFGF